MIPSSSEFSKIYSLEGEHALITGGGTGLGLAMAQCFVAAGARVTIVGRRPEPLRAACQQLGANAACLAADITDPARVATLVPEAEQKQGPFTILVNNAGIHLKKPATLTSDAEFQSVIQTHLFAAFSLSREASKGMLERRRGSILFTASMTSFIGMTQVVAYSAAKSACLGVVRALAAEWSSQGIRVNAIAPGWIRIRHAQKSPGRRPGPPGKNHQPHADGPHGRTVRHRVGRGLSLFAGGKICDGHGPSHRWRREHRLLR